MKLHWCLWAELVVTFLWVFIVIFLYYVTNTCHMIIVLNCLNLPLKISKSLKWGNVPDLFYTFSIYHNACHLGVGESVEWMNEWIHSIKVQHYNLWLGLWGKKATQEFSSVLVHRSSFFPCWNGLLQWLFLSLIMKMTALWYFYLVYLFGFI